MHYENIVIGSSLSAVIYAFNNELPIFYSSLKVPKRIEYLDSEVDLKFFDIENQTRILKTFGSQIKVGVEKRILWDKILFVLSLEGKAPLSTFCSSIRYDGNRIVFSDEYSKISEITFDKCHYFGDDNASGFIKHENIKKYICYDWTAFNVGGKHEYDFIDTEDDFVNKIVYYLSTRRKGNFNIKDACAISYLKPEQIDDFDFSPTMARFKIISEMRSRGMRARIMSYNPTKYRSYKLSYISREIEPYEFSQEPSEDKIILHKNNLTAKDINKKSKLIKTLEKLI
jgi:hypothetical protein